MDAEPNSGTLVVNIGELWNSHNGYLGRVHRVVTPPVGTDRFSVAFSLGARLDAKIPLLDLTPELAAEGRGTASDPQNPLFRDVRAKTLKSRLRSHPDVARRHYADLAERSTV